MAELFINGRTSSGRQGMAVRILLADDHQVVRQGFRAILERQGFEVVAEAADGFEATRLARSVRFDIAVVDLSMPRMNGIETVREMLQAVPECRVILLTMHTEEHQIAAALRAGVRGYVTKSQAAEELSRAISEVFAGGKYFSPAVSGVLLGAYLTGTRLGEDPLTLRERQVLQLVAEGRTSKEVATALGLTPKTAESYRSRLMTKLNIHETAGLVRYAMRQGLVQLIALWCLEPIACACVDYLFL
jgi:DNA-binding NarL/FixJ family response regulator